MKRKKMIFSKENPHEKVKEKEKKIFNFLNLTSLYYFKHDKDFSEAVSFSDSYNFPDGAMIARKLLTKKHRGPDFTKITLTHKDFKKKKHFFIGLNKEEIGLLSKVSGININKINTYNPSYIKGTKFPPHEIKEIVKKINNFNPDYLWVCVGNPKQEILSYKIFKDVKAKKIFNVGAALDFLMGKQKEAPKFFKDLGFEWLYLGFTNPKRTLKKIKLNFIALLYLGRVKKK